MFDFERGNTSAKLLFAGSGIGAIAVAFDDDFLFSIWLWSAFALLAYIAELEDIVLYARRKSMGWGRAMVFRVNDDGIKEPVVEDTFAKRLESFFYFLFAPIYRGYQAVVLAGLIWLVASVVIAVGVFILAFLSILPAGRF